MRLKLALCLVTDSRMLEGRTLTEVVRAAVAGGCTMVQLREKELDTRTFLERAQAVHAMLAGSGVPLIINDRVDIALAIDAEGVHLGQTDMPVSDARRLLGANKIIGLSVENTDDILRANEQDIQYIGISPIFSTSTKTDTARPFGLEGTRRAVALSRHPSVGIGGINSRTVAAAMACGLNGVAVVSDIMKAFDPCQAAKTLRKYIDHETI